MKNARSYKVIICFLVFYQFNKYPKYTRKCILLKAFFVKKTKNIRDKYPIIVLITKIVMSKITF